MSRGSDSVFDEPHMRRGGRCWKCGYDRAGLEEQDRCPECNAGAYETDTDESAGIHHSVWDEAGLPADAASSRTTGRAGGHAGGRTGGPGRLAGLGEDYATWVRGRRDQTTWLMSFAVAWGVAMLAGPLGVLGAFAEGWFGGGMAWSNIIAMAVVGPTVEEVTKVGLLAYIVERRPYLLKSWWQVLGCALAGGAVFAAIENLLYLRVYIDEPSAGIIQWRWTVCVALHSSCSMIAGLGLVRVWRRIWIRGERPDLQAAFPFTLAAIIIHGTYNGSMIVLATNGWTPD